MSCGDGDIDGAEECGEDGDGLVDCADPNCGGRLCATNLVCVAGSCQ